MNSRRHFVKKSLTIPALAVMGASAVVQPAGQGRMSLIKTSCNLYSFNRQLRSGEMTLEEVFQFCSDLGV